MKKQLVFTVLSTITILMVSCGEPKPIPYGYMEQLPEWAPGYVIDTTLDSYPGEPFNNTLPQNWNGEVYDAEVAYRIFLSRIWNCAGGSQDGYKPIGAYQDKSGQRPVTLR